MSKDCGWLSVSRVTGRPPRDVIGEFVAEFGAHSLTGRQMRRYLTDRGWEWVNTRANGDTYPSTGRYIVVCRNGFFGVIDGTPVTDNHRGAVCGYYRRVHTENRAVPLAPE